MRSILKMALGLDTWGLTLSEYGHHVQEGGFSLVSPRNFLLFHHGTLMLHCLSKPHHFAVRTVEGFQVWCESVGLNLSLTHLPTYQIAVVQWSHLDIIGLSCKAYSQLLLESYGPHVIVYHVPSHAGLTENE